MNVRETQAYRDMQREYISGWKTWNVHSALSHVLMPRGLALMLCVKEYRNGSCLREALIGRQSRWDERVYPGDHFGNYTSLRVEWMDMAFTMEIACVGENFAMRVLPEKNQRYPAVLVLETGFLWNRPGVIKGNALLCAFCGQRNRHPRAGRAGRV